MVATLHRLEMTDLAVLSERAALGPDAQAALRGCPDVASALSRLEAAGFTAEALRLLAHALPAREGVWWACMCASSTAPRDLGADDRLARETAELWARQPSDELRHLAMSHAEAGGCTTAEAWAAIAAFWSGESIGRAGHPVVTPVPGQGNGAVGAAVTLAGVRGDGKRHGARLKRMLDSGREIASGGTGRLPAESV